MDLKGTRHLLKKEGLAPKKKLGQNFLVHKHTAQRIVDLAKITQDDVIVEVGVGLGALSEPLARAAKLVIGIEADSGIVRMHQEHKDLPENVQLHHQDILQADLEQLAQESGGRLKIVANLPYSISTPFLFRLFQHSNIMESAVIMLQKEVADRLVAQPGTKEYGVPTVLLSSCAAVKMLMRVKPEEFHPRPKVDSAVVELTFFPASERIRNLDRVEPKKLRKVVNAAFGQRRKTLVNALRGGGFTADKQQITQVIESCGLLPSIRAERLSVEDFVQLTNALDQL
ncbi:MAG TPA: ribosomal RNA small subunit methyltransferase A [Desulfobulbus sp.]|nr:ribosomal RNA small subunit methyltransferase A [Desulfobulbus sp.]